MPWRDVDAGEGREATFVLLRTIFGAGKDFTFCGGAEILGATGMSGTAGGSGARIPADLGGLGAVGWVGAADRRAFKAGAEATGFRVGIAAIFGGGGGCSGVALIDGAGFRCVAAVLAESFGVGTLRVAVRFLVLRVVDLAFFVFGGRSLICPDVTVPPRPEITGNCSGILA